MSIDYNEAFAHQIEILGAVYEPVHALVPTAVRRNFYAANAFEEETEDDPPIVAVRSGSWADPSLDFEQFLGIYEPDVKRIRIFRKGIAWASHHHNWHPQWLERIVRIHEWAHALHHLGSAGYVGAKGTDLARAMRAKHGRYKKAPDDLKEQIAQMITLLSIRHQRDRARYPEVQAICQSLEDLFFELMESQSAKYRIPDIARSMQQPRLQGKISLLLNQSDRGLYPTMDEIVAVFE